MSTRMYRVFRSEVHSVLPRSPSSPIPSGIVISPGAYHSVAYDGVGYDLRLPGVYLWCRFVESAGRIAAANYRLVGGTPTQSLAVIGEMIHRGNKHNRHLSETVNHWLSRMRNTLTVQPVALLCGFASILAMDLFRSMNPGVPIRTAHVLTADPVKTGYEDGHVMLEIYEGGSWKLFDLWNHRYWTNPEVGSPSLCSLADLIPYQPGLKSEFRFSRTWNHGDPYLQGDTHGFHTTAWLMTLNESAWTQRVFQIPGIGMPDGRVYCYIPPSVPDPTGAAAWVSSLPDYVVLASRSEWLTTCY